jgi:hypothetical protein
LEAADVSVLAFVALNVEERTVKEAADRHGNLEGQLEGLQIGSLAVVAIALRSTRLF